MGDSTGHIVSVISDFISRVKKQQAVLIAPKRLRPTDLKIKYINTQDL